MKLMYPDTQEVVIMSQWKRVLFTLLMIPVTIVFIPVLLFVVFLGWLAMGYERNVAEKELANASAED